MHCQRAFRESCKHCQNWWSLSPFIQLSNQKCLFSSTVQLVKYLSKLINYVIAHSMEVSARNHSGQLNTSRRLPG